MATFQVPEHFLYAQASGEDLSSALYKLVKIDTDGDLVLAGDGEEVFGAVTEGAASTYPSTAQFGGIAKVILGGTVTAGQRVASNASGVGVVATTGEYSFGIAMGSGVTSGVISVMIDRAYVA